MDKRLSLTAILVLCIALLVATLGWNVPAARSEANLALSKPFAGAMGTASAVGGWYPIGGGICSVASKHAKGLTLSPQVTGGSIENVRLLANKKVELIMVGAGTANKALSGLKPFTKKYTNMYGLFSFGATACHVITRANSGIKTFNDLKGKKVAVGPPGSGTESIARMVLELAGLTGKIKALPMGFGDMYDALKDGDIDAFFLQATPPGPAVEELARTKPITLLKFSDELIKKIIAKDGAYFKGTLDVGTYTGVKEAIPTAKAASFIACNRDLPEEVAYTFVKAVMQNLKDVRVIHAGARAIKLKDAPNGIVVPIHPGALRFYKEVGVVK